MWSLIIALVLAVVTGAWANKKNRCVIGWAIFGFLFPLIALIILAFLKPLPPAGGSCGCGCGCEEKKE